MLCSGCKARRKLAARAGKKCWGEQWRIQDQDQDPLFFRPYIRYILRNSLFKPANYERNNNDDLISEIEAEMLSFSQKGGIIVQGDYNARTGDIQGVVMNDDNTFLPVPEDYEIDSQFLGIRRIPAQ